MRQEVMDLQQAANHLLSITGHDAEIVGIQCEKQTDRFVDGVQMQSKYCNSGSKCVSECFGTENSVILILMERRCR